MQKTFLKFMVFELVERIARFRLLLNECCDRLCESAPVLGQELKAEAERLEEQLMAHKSVLNRLFSDSGASAGKHPSSALDPAIDAIYTRLREVSRILAKMKAFDLEPEMFLFLKDVLPTELTKEAGEQSVFLAAEGEGRQAAHGLFSRVLMDPISILQKNNPLGWVGLSKSYSHYLLENASSLEALKLELLKGEKKKHHVGVTDALVESMLRHALNLRLLGPAYYFHALAEALFAKDEAFLHFTEPALFYGLNHQNVTHKSLVILHEACERSKPALDADNEEALLPLSKDTLANVFRVVEKLIPAKYAFQEKHLERAIQLQERLSQGVLLSSAALYPLEEVSENLVNTREQENFSIYGPLAMMTEYPHSPKEIVNAGWLHKVERGPVWLYSILNEDREEGFEKVLELLNYQDHLLRKSIEVSEVHRVLLCSR